MDKLKLVKTIVFILTFLLVFGSLMLIGTLFKKTKTLPRLPKEINLQEPVGSRISNLQTKENLLYLTISDGGLADRIIIFNTTTGQKISTIYLNQREQ